MRLYVLNTRSCRLRLASRAEPVDAFNTA